MSSSEKPRGCNVKLPPVKQVISKLTAEVPYLPTRGTESVSQLEQERIFTSLQSFLKEVKDDEAERLTGELHSTSDQANLAVTCRRQDIEALKDVPEILHRLWRCRSDYMTSATEVLATESRKLSWRAPYGRVGILDFFLRLIATKEDVDNDLLLHSLRLIGNSCADTDENREIVMKGNYMLAIIQHLLNPELIHVAVPVIFNICVDFEPAQSQAAANRISYILLKLMKDGAIMEGSNPLSFAYELIEMASTKEQESKVEQSPDGTIQLITELALGASLDLAQFSCLVNSLVAYLEIQRFRDICILRNQIEGVLSVLKQSFFILVDSSSSDDLQTLPQLRLKINQSLAEVSGSPLFMETYSLDSTVSQTLISWLRTGNEEQLQICSCVMLGNLARTDEICQRMVRDLNIHIDLISILKSDSKGAVLHAALGFLKNLAIAPDNKVDLGDAGIIPAVSHLWGFESVPQVQFSAASIVRQVISSSIENVARLLSPLSTESGLPVHTQTYLSQLLLLFEKTDSTPIKIDIGRTVASICRTLSPRARDENSEANALFERLFGLHDGVARPVGAMVTQTQWPVVRSEGWFALALMASSRPGSLAVVDCLQITDVYQSLKESLGAEIPEETTEADKSRITKDGSNIIILVKELLGNASDVLPSDLKAMLHGFMCHDVSQRLKSTAE